MPRNTPSYSAMGTGAHRGREARLHFSLQKGGDHRFPIPRPEAHLCQSSGHERGPYPGASGIAGAIALAMTQRYSHLSPEQLQNAVKVLDGVIEVRELAGRETP